MQNHTLIEQTGVVSVTNQIELHPYSQKTAWAAYNADHAIMTQCWSPLGRKTSLLKDDALAQFAEQLGRVPALECGVGRGFAPTPTRKCKTLR